MLTNDPKVLEALAHVATCEDCQKWLSEASLDAITEATT